MRNAHRREVPQTTRRRLFAGMFELIYRDRVAELDDRDVRYSPSARLPVSRDSVLSRSHGRSPPGDRPPANTPPAHSIATRSPTAGITASQPTPETKISPMVRVSRSAAPRTLVFSAFPTPVAPKPTRRTPERNGASPQHAPPLSSAPCVQSSPPPWPDPQRAAWRGSIGEAGGFLLDRRTRAGRPNRTKASSSFPSARGVAL
jgi:hypothetical protein